MSHHTRTVNTAPLKAIAARVLNYVPKDSVSVDTIEEWAYEAYASIAPREVYEVHLALIEINNSKGVLPEMFELEMVLYKEFDSLGITRTNTFTNNKSTFTTTTDLITGTSTNKFTQVQIVTKTKEDKVKIMSDQDIGTFDSVNGKITKKQKYYDNGRSKANWKPLPLSTNVFHNLPVSGILANAPQSIYKNCSHAFAIKNGCITTTFNEGVVLIAYTGLPADDEGNIVYVDTEDVNAALEAAVLKKYYMQRWLRGNVAGAQGKYNHFLQLSNVLMPKASGALMMPGMIEYQNLRNINKFIKEDSPFSIMMGALGGAEVMHFENPPRYGNTTAIFNRRY